MRRPILTLAVPAILAVATCGFNASAAVVRHSRDLAASVRLVSSTMPEGASDIDIGPRLWSARGISLRDLLSQVYGLEPARLDLGTIRDNERFDISLPLRGDESDEAIQQALESALATQLDLRLSFETRTVETVVLRSADSAGAGLRAVSFETSRTKDGLAPGEISVSGQRCPDLVYAEIRAHAATISGLASALEDNLNRPVVDETGLTGTYDFTIPEYRTQDELFQTLKQNLGLTVTTEQRTVNVLAVRPASHTEYELRTGI